MKCKMKILLTFDTEEFDELPVSKVNEKFEQSMRGLIELDKLLDKHKVKATFFTTAVFAKKYPGFIKSLQKKGHEIACHGLEHKDNYLDKNNFKRISQSKAQLEKLKLKIRGFRAPRFQIKDIQRLENLGFEYDSSIHPTFLPGKYINLFKKRSVHYLGNIVEIPPSVLPLLRLPIAWFAFKNLGPLYPKVFTKLNNLFSNYTMIIFHPWEFSDLKPFKLPLIIKRKNGKELLNLLESYILFCKKQKYEFSTVSKFLFPKVL